MNSFSKKGRSGGFKNYKDSRERGERNDKGSKSFFSKKNYSDREDRSYGRGSDRPQSYKAVCDDCGKDCTLPFKPTGNKPVYCSNCFEKHGNGGKASFSRPNRSNSDIQEQINEINRKLDKVLDILNR